MYVNTQKMHPLHTYIEQASSFIIKLAKDKFKIKMKELIIRTCVDTGGFNTEIGFSVSIKGDIGFLVLENKRGRLFDT